MRKQLFGQRYGEALSWRDTVYIMVLHIVCRHLTQMRLQIKLPQQEKQKKKGLHIHEGNFHNLDYKCFLMAAKPRDIAISKLCSVFSLQGIFWINLVNYEKKKKIGKISIFWILPDLHGSLVEVHNFPSLHVKIVATNCEVHNYHPV